jgi:hypothetical protein
VLDESRADGPGRVVDDSAEVLGNGFHPGASVDELHPPLTPDSRIPQLPPGNPRDSAGMDSLDVDPIDLPVWLIGFDHLDDDEMLLLGHWMHGGPLAEQELLGVDWIHNAIVPAPTRWRCLGAVGSMSPAMLIHLPAGFAGLGGSTQVCPSLWTSLEVLGTGASAETMASGNGANCPQICAASNSPANPAVINPRVPCARLQ